MESKNSFYVFGGGPEPSGELALDKRKKHIIFFFLGKSSKRKAMDFIAMDDLPGLVMTNIAIEHVDL